MYGCMVGAYKCGGCKWWVDGSTSVVDVFDVVGKKIFC